jgi:hypothetical protein
MYHPDTGFGLDCLHEQVNSDGQIQYALDQWKKLAPQDKCSIGLLHILKGYDLNLFDKIIKWRYDCQQQYNHYILPSATPQSRETAVRKLQRMYGYNQLNPTVKEVNLPGTKSKVNLVVFPFGDMLLSLLTDPVLMQERNLTIDPKNPFTVPKKGDHFGDFQTGCVHRLAYDEYCTRGQNNVLCEITLFVDKTHLDIKGKHTLEPIMFTLGIFKWSIRVLPSAW